VPGQSPSPNTYGLDTDTPPAHWLCRSHLHTLYHLARALPGSIRAWLLPGGTLHTFFAAHVCVSCHADVALVFLPLPALTSGLTAALGDDLVKVLVIDVLTLLTPLLLATLALVSFVALFVFLALTSPLDSEA